MAPRESAGGNVTRLSLWQFYRAAGCRAVEGKFELARWWQALATLVLGLGCTIAFPFITGGWPVVSALLTAIGWIPFAVFAAVFLGVLIRDTVRAPHQVYLERALEAEAANMALAELRRPVEQVLEFVGPGERESETLRKLPGAKVHRIALRNRLPASQIVGVEVTLVGYTNLDTGERAPIAREVQDMRGNKTVDIAPGAMRHFNAILVRPDKSPARLYFGPWDEALSPHTSGPGRYQLEIEAISAIAPPLPGRFLLEMAANGKVSLTLVS
jgi:hypothetical protein